MTKEQLLQLVSEAYDEGADIRVYFHNIRGEKEAGELADQFAEFFESPCETINSERSSYHKYESGNVECTTFFDKEVPV
jgi:hypothetical protein